MNPYKPKNNIYVIRSKGGVDKIIGSKEDSPLITKLGMIEIMRGMKNSDIVKGILRLPSEFKKVRGYKNDI